MTINIDLDTIVRIIPVVVGLLAFLGFSGQLKEWLERRKKRNILLKGPFDEDVIRRATSYFIEPQCQNLDPAGEVELRCMLTATKEPLFENLDKFIEIDSSYRHLMIMADSGTGKTTSVLNYYARSERMRRKKRHIALIPPGHKDADKFIENLLTKNEIAPDKTVIILDAFDEDILAIENTLKMKFVYIWPGRFMMGSRGVTLSKGFFMQTTQVTQGQWKALMGKNPSSFKKCGDDCPVEGVSWNDAQDFIKKLNKHEGVNNYRLPTEAEWEYAARAGSNTDYCFGDDEAELTKYAWYVKNSGRRTHPVALKKPNDWGLYDMHGNVWEWVQDWYGDYPSGSVTDPVGPENGSDRVIRGGSWYDCARRCRSAFRYYYAPVNRYYDGVGFRLSFLRS